MVRKPGARVSTQNAGPQTPLDPASPRAASAWPSAGPCWSSVAFGGSTGPLPPAPRGASAQVSPVSRFDGPARGGAETAPCQFLSCLLSSALPTAHPRCALSPRKPSLLPGPRLPDILRMETEPRRTCRLSFAFPGPGSHRGADTGSHSRRGAFPPGVVLGHGTGRRVRGSPPGGADCAPGFLLGAALRPIGLWESYCLKDHPSRWASTSWGPRAVFLLSQVCMLGQVCAWWAPRGRGVVAAAELGWALGRLKVGCRRA